MMLWSQWAHDRISPLYWATTITYHVTGTKAMPGADVWHHNDTSYQSLEILPWYYRRWIKRKWNFAYLGVSLRLSLFKLFQLHTLGQSGIKKWHHFNFVAFGMHLERNVKTESAIKAKLLQYWTKTNKFCYIDTPCKRQQWLRLSSTMNWKRNCLVGLHMYILVYH